MKNNPIISLRDFTDDDVPFGNKQGKKTYARIQKALNNYPSSKIIGISFKGIHKVDLTFCRESIVNLVRFNLGEVSFYIKDLENSDNISNLKAAAEAKKQFLVIFNNDLFDIIGPNLSSGMKEIFDYIMNKCSVTTTDIVKRFPKLSTPNASGKLKKLIDLGLITGAKKAAESGGLEYVFSAIINQRSKL